ncbi:cold shock domain-containing protein [Methylomonas sp. EFPC3]|uniref:cold shock domain-containing protein n=1 Tax=Methylomonas sp. EFPC3 TaxID=3021710 RepID=UPI002417E99B|nr:cold shock domain-containing protein [Methylomonas sp. EFPC3]WFP49816.1 cold shock domain-containing protein [Methylomonas sp. EFPC3]
MKGKINQWNDEKGFGFIVSDDDATKVFFHISSLKTSSRRPQVGDSVVYESTVDAKQRLQAKAVVIIQASTQRESQQIQVTPPQKNALDYFLILILLGCLGKISWDFYQTQLLTETMAPFAIAAVVAFLILNRQKTPKEKQFSCARCKAVANFDARTIQAWNNGFLKLYCNPCHQRWLRENPTHPIRSYGVGRGSGCLVLLCVFSTMPVLAAVAVYLWMT